MQKFSEPISCLKKTEKIFFVNSVLKQPLPAIIVVIFYLISNVELSIFHCTFRILKHNEKVLFDFDGALFWQIEPWPHLNDLFKAIKIPLTCSRHRNLQNICIRILQIFCYDFFCLIKSRANHSGATQPFLNHNMIFFPNAPQIICHRIIKKNQNKDLENSNSNILEVPMSRTS